MSEIEVGDPEFEREHSIAADEPERVRVVLDREMRQVLQEAARTSPHFSVDDSGISIVFGPGEENERSLESSLRTAGRVARLMTERRERIPVAAPLRQHRQAWTAYAAAMGMECMDCPLYIRGRMECATISARAVRLASLRYRLEVLVRFDTPLGLGLSATPSSSTDAARSQACGQDEKLGDPVFDDAFTTRISRPEVLSSILDAETRQRLLEVQGLVDSVQLDDDGVTVRAAQIDPEPTAVPRLVALVRSLAGGIARNAAAVGSKISGPYR
ncbi:MAG: hypothetical protein HYY06_10645 [Deltaproteobacteria bacterium]|nr:hypothetical protein [Deltaproteobacteria bacterium]